MRILIGGDFVPRARVAELIEKGDYSFLDELKKLIADESDYAIVNLEAPIEITEGEPIVKVGPHLQCSPKTLDAIKYSGISLLCLANNHILDYGGKELLATIKECEEKGISTVGAGKDLEDASKLQYFDVCDKKVAVINCCEKEYSQATQTTPGTNPLNPVNQFYEIKEAKEKADYVLVIVHGGHEYFQLPSPRMQDLYRYFIDCGADAVINGHQHCYSGYEFYKGHPIVYGLGNLCFDWPGETHQCWYEGYLAGLEFNEDSIGLKIYPYIQCETKPKIEFTSNQDFYLRIKELNSIISDRKKLEKTVASYYEANEPYIESMLQSVSNKVARGLRRFGIVKSFVTERSLRSMSNIVLCESHRDKLEFFFKNRILHKK